MPFTVFALGAGFGLAQTVSAPVPSDPSSAPKTSSVTPKPLSPLQLSDPTGYVGMEINYAVVPFSDYQAWSYGFRVGSRDLWLGVGGRLETAINLVRSEWTASADTLFSVPLEGTKIAPYAGVGLGINYNYASTFNQYNRNALFLEGVAGLELPAGNLSGVRFFSEAVPRFYLDDSGLELHLRFGLHFAL